MTGARHPWAGVAAIVTLTLSGCAFFSQDQRDAQACSALQNMSDSSESLGRQPTPLRLAADIRLQALPEASARLGRDLSNLAGALEDSETLPSATDFSATYVEIETLSLRISERCSALTYSVALTAAPASPVDTGPADAALPPAQADSAAGQQEPSDGSAGGTQLSGTIADLRVEPEGPGGYDRELFDHWVDLDGNGCDTRREVLIQESLTPVTVGPGCSLSGGQWQSDFDGATTTNPSDFDIDHLVPLKEAWDSGAYTWSDDRREAFANDLTSPVSLIAVSARSNRSKGAKDPAEWLPPDATFHCDYVAQWIDVKVSWDLSVDEAELAAIESVRDRC